MTDPHDRRGSGFNELQLNQLQTMVHVSVQEQLQSRSDDEIDEIAEKAAEKAIQKLTDEAYRAVGKTIVQKLFYIIGLLALALGGWALKNGWIKP